jgi:sugar (pentulose or hexulose) kinase
MNFLTIDLGTTNIKVGCFDSDFNQLSMQTVEVNYHRNKEIVEFEPEKYFESVVAALKNCVQAAGINYVSRITLTGQAESLVILDKEGNPVRKAISWLDNRSVDQSNELSQFFGAEKCYKITGQPEMLATWPITKILWLKQNENQSFEKADKYLMLKDYIAYKLTGKIVGEYSIYNFSHYFDIVKKDYWQEILDYVGIKKSQLPPLFEPCTDIGKIKCEVANYILINNDVEINIGTLDHFAGMIGTGNIKSGAVSESTGTVMSISTMVDKPLFSEYRVGCHYGPFKNSYVLLAICESGGISLEWFKREFLNELSFKDLDTIWASKSLDNTIVFLPYVNGTNAPDFDKNAKGVFYGLNVMHDKYDMSFAIMEGVSHLLTNNIEFFEKLGVITNTIVATGGGSKSDVWLQLKSDIIGKQVLVPQNEEAASIGCAIIGAVSAGVYPSYEEAVEKCIKINKILEPKNTLIAQKKHELFNILLEQMKKVFSYKI